MNYGTYANTFQAVPDFSHQSAAVQSNQDPTGDANKGNMVTSVAVNNIQGVQTQDRMPEILQSIATSRVQTVNSTNYILNTPAISQPQQVFSTSNQFAPVHYISAPTSITSNDIQIAWTDPNRSNNLLSEHLKNSISVPIFSTLPHNALHMNSPAVWSVKSVSVDSVGTMTDPILSSEFLDLKTKNKTDFDSTDCSKLNIGMQSSALLQYMSRMPPQILPLSFQNFLKKHNIPYNIKVLGNNLLSQGVSAIGMGSVNVTICKDNRTKSPVYKPKTFNPLVDGATNFNCNVCDLEFPDEASLQNHALVSDHEPDRRFRCEECGVCLKRKEHLDQHRKGHSQDRPFVCSICYKGFKRSEHLKRHYGTHSDQKCFSCRICGKAFYRKDHLAKHEQTHVNRKISDSYETSQLSHGEDVSEISEPDQGHDMISAGC